MVAVHEALPEHLKDIFNDVLCQMPWPSQDVFPNVLDMALEDWPNEEITRQARLLAHRTMNPTSRGARYKKVDSYTKMVLGAFSSRNVITTNPNPNKD